MLPLTLQKFGQPGFFAADGLSWINHAGGGLFWRSLGMTQSWRRDVMFSNNIAYTWNLSSSAPDMSIHEHLWPWFRCFSKRNMSFSFWVRFVFESVLPMVWFVPFCVFFLPGVFISFASKHPGLFSKVANQTGPERRHILIFCDIANVQESRVFVGVAGQFYVFYVAMLFLHVSLCLIYLNWKRNSWSWSVFLASKERKGDMFQSFQSDSLYSIIVLDRLAYSDFVPQPWRSHIYLGSQTSALPTEAKRWKDVKSVEVLVGEWPMGLCDLCKEFWGMGMWSTNSFLKVPRSANVMHDMYQTDQT